MSKRAKISVVCLSALMGIALASFQSGEIWIAGFCLVAIVTFCIAGRFFIVAASIIILLSLGWFMLSVRMNQPRLASYVNQAIQFEGVIRSLNQDGFNTEAILATQLVQNKKIHANFILKNSALENMEVGDAVLVRGVYTAPSEKMQQYYFSKNISGDIFVQEAAKTQRTFLGNIQNVLWRLHEFCLKKIRSVFLQPVDAMLGALLLGARTEVPKEITDAFKQTGTTHILALSGYNISIIFSTFELVLAKFLRPKIRYTLASLCIILFVLLVGPSSSIVRAAVMGILAGLVARSSRITSGVTVLLFASTIMVLLNPKILAFDVSFQLSALATFGIIAFEKVIEGHLKLLPHILQLREVLATTIAAQIPTIPILIYTFHSLSTLSLLANILVLPLVPFIMATGFSGLVLSFVSVPLAKLFAPLPSLLVNIMDQTLIFLGHWHFALLQLRIPLPVLIMYSIFVIIAFVYMETKKV